MPVIDDEGNLFGVVNVIDALAVCLILAVVVAGIAVIGVLGSADGEPTERYATVELGDQPSYIADQIEAGDEMPVDGFSQNVTVTDVHVSPASSGENVIVRTELEGELVEQERTDPVFEFAGERLRVGNTIDLETLEYVAEGQITSLEESGTELPTQTTSVVLESTVSETTVSELDEGDTVDLGDRIVATVANVRSYGTENDQRRVQIGVDLETIRLGESTTFAGGAVSLGNTVALDMDGYSVSGEIVRRGATELDSESSSRYVTLDLGSQPDYIVDRVAAGDEMAVGEESLTVTDVHVSPASSGDGYLTVRAEVDGRLVERADRSDPTFEFAGERLRVGNGLEIDLDEYNVSGQVTDVDTDGEGLETGHTPVLLESTVSDRTADEIQVGDAFELGPHTVATVTTVQTYPIGADQYRAHVGATLETLTRGGAPTFGDRQVTVGSQLSLSTDAYDLEGEVIRRGADEAAGEETTTTARLSIENVRPAVGDGLSEGMTETERGETLATLQSIDRQPAEVILESEGGEIFLREHPRNEDLTLTVDLATRQTETGLRFHGESLREGDSITLDFGSRIVQGEVTQLESS